MSPETEAFLIELARATQRLGMYPPGHPVITAMVASVHGLLTPILDNSTTLTIDVSRNHLTIGEHTTSEEHTLFHAMARRLYRHLIFKLSFQKGIEADEIRECITAISVKPVSSTDPIGVGSESQLTRWPHIVIEVTPFTSLSLAEAEDGEADPFATGLDGDGAMGQAHGTGGAGAGAASDQAQSAGGGIGADEALSQAQSQLADLNLTKLAGVLRNTDTSNPATLNEGVSKLILGMKPETMRDLVGRLPESYKKSATESVVETTIREIIEASDAGEADNASSALLRLLTKLAMLNEDSGEPISTEDDQQLAALLQHLGAGWDIENPNPKDYDSALRSFNQAAQQLSVNLEWEEEPDAERIVQISVEIDEMAPTTLRATTDMIAEGQTGGLMNILEDAPSVAEAPEALWLRVDRKDTVSNVLDYQPVDYLTLDRVITRIWEVAAGPMLDRMLDSDSRTERMSLLERLERLGPDIGPAILERLDDGPWFRVRNLLKLLGRFPELPDGFSPWTYIDHNDPRVRREAYAIALDREAYRDRAIRQALEDPDSLVIELALEIIMNRCPHELIPNLVAMIHDPASSSRIKLACIRCMGSSRSAEALDALCSLVWYRKWLILNSLTPKSATMLAALSVLTQSWRHEPRAIQVLRLAQRSSDPQIQAVVRSTGAAA